jgi:hypothetical protein
LETLAQAAQLLAEPVVPLSREQAAIRRAKADKRATRPFTGATAVGYACLVLRSNRFFLGLDQSISAARNYSLSPPSE